MCFKASKDSDYKLTIIFKCWCYNQGELDNKRHQNQNPETHNAEQWEYKQNDKLGVLKRGY